MAHEGTHEGFHVFDEIVCEAVSVIGLAPSVCHPGINEGMPVEKELIWRVPSPLIPPSDSTNLGD